MHLDLWSINHPTRDLRNDPRRTAQPSAGDTSNPVIAKFSRFWNGEKENFAARSDSHCPRWRCIIPQYKTFHPRLRDNAFKMMPAFFPPLVKNDPKSKSLIFADSHCWLRLRVISPFLNRSIRNMQYRMHLLSRSVRPSVFCLFSFSSPSLLAYIPCQ